MDLSHYTNAIESSVDDPERLEQLRRGILADDSLSDEDKDYLSTRVGTYLADADRAQERPEGFSLDDAPFEDEED